MRSAMRFCDLWLQRVIPLICLIVCCQQIADCIIKYLDAPTTTSKRPVPNKEATIAPPHFTVCADPYVNETAIKELGLDLNMWSMFDRTDNVSKFSTWPIKDSFKDLRLYEKTTFGLREMLNNFYFKFQDNNILYENFPDEFEEKYLQILVLNTFYNGRCFTFKPRELKLPSVSPVVISLKNVWISTKTAGRFTIYVHDEGLEFNIITQIWHGAQPLIAVVEPGEAVEMVLTRYIEKSVPMRSIGPVENSKTCKEWSSPEMVACIEDILLQNVTAPECRLPMTIFRGNLTNMSMPLCSNPDEAWNFHRNEYFATLNTQVISGKCPPPCEAVLYDGKVSTYKTGSNEMTPIWISYSSATVMIQEEYLLYDFGTVVAAVGGNLGLFIGLSVLSLIQFSVKRMLLLSRRKTCTICV